MGEIPTVLVHLGKYGVPFTRAANSFQRDMATREASFGSSLRDRCSIVAFTSSWQGISGSGSDQNTRQLGIPSRTLARLHLGPEAALTESSTLESWKQ